VKRFRVLSVVLVLALLLTPATALAAGTHVVSYTALGDSIAAGVGGTDSVGYTDLLAKRLAQGNRDVTFNDLGVSGMTSGGLLGALAYDYTYQAAVADADVITVSIGGNDILQPALGLVSTRAGYAGYTDPVAYLASLSYPEQLALASELNTMLSPALTQLPTNWPTTIGAIRGLNPGASIYVNTLYNPFMRGDGLFEMVDPYVQGINSMIAAGAPGAGYTVVDVYAKFAAYADPSEPLVHGLASPAALHPTDEGYRVIFNLHKSLMKKGPY
jgi:lysophospholipase L1-like esterase